MVSWLWLVLAVVLCQNRHAGCLSVVLTPPTGRRQKPRTEKTTEEERNVSLLLVWSHRGVQKTHQNLQCGVVDGSRVLVFSVFYHRSSCIQCHGGGGGGACPSGLRLGGAVLTRGHPTQRDNPPPASEQHMVFMTYFLSWPPQAPPLPL